MSEDNLYEIFFIPPLFASFESRLDKQGSGKPLNDHLDYSVINTCKSNSTYEEYMKKKKTVFLYVYILEHEKNQVQIWSY